MDSETELLVNLLTQATVDGASGRPSVNWVPVWA